MTESTPMERIADLEQRMAIVYSVQERTNETLIRLSLILDRMNEFLILMTPRVGPRNTEH